MKIKTKEPPLYWTRRPNSPPAGPSSRPGPPRSVAPSPSLFPRPGSEQGHVPAAPPRRRRGRIRPPRPASSITPPTRPHSRPRFLRLSLLPRIHLALSFPFASERHRRHASGLATATVPTSPPHGVSKARRRPLLRLVQPVGDRSHRNAPPDVAVFLLCSDKLRRRSSPTPAAPLHLLNP